MIRRDSPEMIPITEDIFPSIITVILNTSSTNGPKNVEFPYFLPFFFVLQGCLINEWGMGFFNIFTSKTGCEKKDTNRHLDTDDRF
jgi:hypothetical protein